MNTYHICGLKAAMLRAEGRRERARLEGRRFFITDPSEHDITPTTYNLQPTTYNLLNY
ncbi:MAG: hypothetical protein F6K17_13995 [Okeania sp. SIO3C4]|nr:hypothetical protein [Okeania sp. SIO3C4]